MQQNMKSWKHSVLLYLLKYVHTNKNKLLVKDKFEYRHIKSINILLQGLK